MREPPQREQVHFTLTLILAETPWALTVIVAFPLVLGRVSADNSHFQSCRRANLADADQLSLHLSVPHQLTGPQIAEPLKETLLLGRGFMPGAQDGCHFPLRKRRLTWNDL
jgi:hypothetical protein